MTAISLRLTVMVTVLSELIVTCISMLSWLEGPVSRPPGELQVQTHQSGTIRPDP